MIAISLITPVLNEELTIPRLLASVKQQTLPPVEHIFVDAGSIDGTVALLEKASIENPCIKIVKVSQATPGKGRNIGIKLAASDWLAPVDSGIELEPDWLERLAGPVIADPSLDVVFGNVAPITDTFFTRAAALAYAPIPVEVKGSFYRGPSVTSMLISRRAWITVGEFPDLRAAEDLIFIEELKNKGLNSIRVPEAVVHWELAPNLRLTFARFFNYSKHNVWANRERTWHYGVLRQYIAVAVITGFALTQSGWWAVLVLLGWFLARVFKSIWVRRESRNIRWVFNLPQFGAVGAIIFSIDLAMFIGWIAALLKPTSVRSAGYETTQVQS